MTVYYIACFLGLLSFIGGLLVLLRAGNKLENKIFFAVSLLSVIWSISFSSIELSSDIGVVDFLNKFSFFVAILLLFSATSFMYFFPVRQKTKSLFIYGMSLLPLALLSFTELISGEVSRNDSGGYSFSSGPLIPIYVAAFVVGIILIIVNSARARKKVQGQAKSQLDFVMFGYSLTLIFGISLAIILPLFDPSTKIDDLAPASLTITILMVSYAIIRHKLFDFRSLLARSFAYLVSISLLVTAYVLAITVIKRLLFPDQELTNAQLVVNVVVTVLLISAYSRIKEAFDNLTNRLFFRDNYDPQVMLDHLNQTLVSNTEIEELLTKTALIIQENLKTTFATFYIRETSYFTGRIIGAHRQNPEFDNIEIIEQTSSKIKKKVFSTEHEYQSEYEEELAKLLKNDDVEVLIRLVNTLDYEVKGIGYLFIGPKKSGRTFTAKDFQTLEIIANELVIAIENVLRFEEIEQFNVTLQKKIDDATKELKQTNQKLLALDEAKDEFVSMASHQLRTPLTSIKGYLSMVLEGDAGKLTATQKDMLGQAFFSSQRMVYLISDLLNVSRLKTGKFIIEPKPVYLPELINSEINQLQEGAKAKNVTLSFKKPDNFPTMNLDDMKIRQVVMNFADNAIYYTPAHGKINIELRETDKAVEFRVKDTGIGVPAKEKHKLFTKFYRAENARKTRPDGTGLGLFMAKKVIVAQGGSVIFDSKEGQGSTFGFSFPKEKLEVGSKVETKADKK